MHQEEITGKEKFLKKLNNFLAQYSRVLIIISILIVIAVISIAISGTFKSGKMKNQHWLLKKYRQNIQNLCQRKVMFFR